jgi:hypothetical protein
MTPQGRWMCGAALALAMNGAGCRIGDNLPDAGEECRDTTDCEGLACVPTDADNPGGPRVCMPAPDGWDEDRCKVAYLGDKDNVCDCGCGALDYQCADDNATSCGGVDPDGDPISGNNCPAGQNPVADDNTRCE